jgi:hypothetical protein
MALQEGDRFADFRAFKTAVQDWGLKGQIKFNFRYQKSDSTSKIVVGAHAGCPFRIYAVLSGNKEYVSVATVVDTSHEIFDHSSCPIDGVQQSSTCPHGR